MEAPFRLEPVLVPGSPNINTSVGEMDGCNPKEIVKQTAILTATQTHENFHEITDLCVVTEIELGSEESTPIQAEVPKDESLSDKDGPPHFETSENGKCTRDGC